MTRSDANPAPGRFNRSYGIFLACLLFSLILWMLVSMSHEFQGQLPVSVSYSELSAERRITNTLPDHWMAIVRGKGWDLLSYKLFKKELKVEVALDQLEAGLIYPADYISEIEKQLRDQIGIESLSPSQIRVNTTELSASRLPVRARMEVGLESGLEMVSPVRLTPDSIDVYGDESDLSELEAIFSSEFRLQAQSNDTQFILALRNPDTLRFRLSVNEVIAEIDLGSAVRYTDTLELTVKGVPEGVEVRLVPERIRVSYTIVDGQRRKDVQDSLRAEVDYERLINSDLRYADVELPLQPANARNLLIDPASVEFIIFQP